MRLARVFSAVAVPGVLAALGVAFCLAPVQQVSVVEGRALATWPACSWASVKDGSCTRGIDDYVADHFPFREGVVAFTFGLRERFGVHLESTVYRGQGGALGGFENAAEWRPPVEAALYAAVELDPFVDEDAGAPQVEEVVDEAAVIPSDDELDAGLEVGRLSSTVEGGVVIHQGRGMMLLSATDDTARAFAKVLNAWAVALPKTHLYAVMVPGAGAFYLPEAWRSQGADERHNLEVMKAALVPQVTWVDVMGALDQHRDEALYYGTDHHWTGLGAYYGYRAMAEAAQLTPLRRDELVWKTASAPTLGSLYRMTHDAQLARTPDVTEYVLPSVEYQSVSYRGARFDVPVRRPFVDEGASGYLVFMGGDAPLMAAKTTVRNGRRALLVKNSFGNPLGPLLLPHFEQVVVVDYRLYFDTITALVRRFRITDVFIQNATLTANDGYHRGRMKLVLATPVTFVDGGVVYGRPPK